MVSAAVWRRNRLRFARRMNKWRTRRQRIKRRRSRRGGRRVSGKGRVSLVSRSNSLGSLARASQRLPGYPPSIIVVNRYSDVVTLSGPSVVLRTCQSYRAKSVFDPNYTKSTGTFNDRASLHYRMAQLYGYYRVLHSCIVVTIRPILGQDGTFDYVPFKVILLCADLRTTAATYWADFKHMKNVKMKTIHFNDVTCQFNPVKLYGVCAPWADSDTNFKDNITAVSTNCVDQYNYTIFDQVNDPDVVSLPPGYQMEVQIFYKTLYTQRNEMISSAPGLPQQ